MFRSFLALFRPAVAQPGGLISVLTDPSAPLCDRDDAAMDLGSYDGALSTLIAVAKTPNEDDMIVDSCSESIWEILGRTGQFDQADVAGLPQVWQEAIQNLKRAKNA